jgi:lipase chaperone LimK
LQAVEKREDPFDRYQTELELREKEFIGLSVEDKEKKLYSLEVKYFGKEKADLMAKTRKEEQDYTSKIENYKKIEEDFLKSNSGLKPEEKERKLKELRIKHLGEEEAESYKNRLQFEEETKNL